MKTTKIIITLSMFLLFSMNLSAFCSEPGTPFSKPTKPSPPFCVNEWNNTHTCDDWQINNYYSDLENYQYEVQRYVQQLQDYVQDANNYAECEIRNLE